MLDLTAHRHRREQLMETLGPDAVAVFPAPAESLRNGDAHHPYRQSSDLYYLTGFAEPEAVLVLRPGAEAARVTMFVRPRDPERETWDGRRAGVEGAKRVYGADEAYPIDELSDRLLDLIANADALHYALGEHPRLDAEITRLMASLRRWERRGKHAPRQIVDPRFALHEMRLHKRPEELALMRRAAAITVEAHREAMRAARPGAYEYEIEALVDYAFRRAGATGPGYSSIVGGGDNATILHYIENNAELRDGELLLIDAGCELGFYTADVTRTFPINGRFTPPQRQLYELVLAALDAGIAMTRPGMTLDDIHERCVQLLTEGMVELGLLEAPAEARVADGSYKRFYMHRTSHWLGMDVHDVGAYNQSGAPRPLAPGMVLTIEPGIYIPSDAADVPEPFRGIGIRIEDDVLVTADGADNLTAACPRTVAEVEAACAGS